MPGQLVVEAGADGPVMVGEFTGPVMVGELPGAGEVARAASEVASPEREASGSALASPERDLSGVALAKPEARKALGAGRWAVLVNTSLERSVRCVPKLKDEALKIHVVSPEDGSMQLADLKRGLWLPAGQGVLLQLK